jgi:hypothetical protein
MKVMTTWHLVHLRLKLYLPQIPEKLVLMTPR